MSLADAWSYARTLIRAGLCERLRSVRYIDGMVVAAIHQSIGRTLRQTLLADPGLLDDEAWEIFAVEPIPGRLDILSVSSFGPSDFRWEVALAGLAAEGRIDRVRLLDASLDGLERDFHEARARWFAAMHEALRPTLDERAERGDRTLGLLGSRNPSTVLFALKAVGVLDKADRLDPAALLDAVGPALLARAQGTALLAIGLVAHAAGRRGDLGGRAADVALDALAHEAPAVHRAAIDLVVRHGNRADPALVDRVRDRVDAVAASERPRLVEWLGAVPSAADPAPVGLDDLIARAEGLDPHWAALAGVPEALAAVAGGGDLAPLRFEVEDAPRLDPARRIEPVADLDGLIDLFAQVLEGTGAAEDVERLLDGVSRLCDQVPADFAARTAPLRSRAAEWGPYGGYLGRLTIAWIDGTPTGSRRVHWPDDLFGIFERRLIALGDRASERQAAPLLAAPTHRGGWIDPLVLVDRVRTWADLGNRVDRLDAAQAFLRLAPDSGPRAAALRAAANLAGPVAEALRHALGGSGAVVGPDARLWVAAARARNPLGDDPLVEAPTLTSAPTPAGPQPARSAPARTGLATGTRSTGGP